jgi:L-seryl-tRNA(Ser) seleniumtransferase
MKISKELVMGCLAAVEMWVHGRDHEQEHKEQVAMIDHIRGAVKDIESVHFDYQEYDSFGVTPKLWVFWDHNTLKLSDRQAHDALFYGEPRIKMYVNRGGLWIRPYTMYPGEERIVARRLREVLTSGGAIS